MNEQKKIRFGSVCSGIEAASVAWHPLGWQAAWLSEIEPFPSAVLKHHYPDVPNLGDMTKLPERILSGEVEAPDLFCGGTPCQAFSVAGLRNSLEDARGNLSLTFVGIANAIDHVRSVRRDDPAIIFWENVPGVLSTKDNAFGCFLGALAGEDDPLIAPGGKWTNAGCVYGPQRTVAWRVLDAQYFGVAQRRRRVFVVASARDGFDPAKVLFEWGGVRRDSAPSREKGKAVARGAGACSAERGNCRGIAPTLDANMDRKWGSNQWTNSGFAIIEPIGMSTGQANAETITEERTPALTSLHEAPMVQTFSTPEIGHIVKDDVASTITKHTGGGGETQNPAFVAQPINIYGGNKRADRPEGGFYVRTDEDTSKTLDAATGLNPTCSQGGTAVMQPIHYRKSRRAQSTTDHETWVEDDAANTLNCFDVGDIRATDVVAQPVAVGCLTPELPQRVRVHGIDGTAPTLSAEHGRGHGVPTVMTTMQVRRLTPVECERLQGFPDDYTNIPWRKKPESPDGPRYKALGNSWAVPNVRWIGQRIADQINKKTS